jgi:hypothetical protein
MRRAKNAKICLPVGITTKSDFVFAQPRPVAVILLNSAAKGGPRSTLA